MNMMSSLGMFACLWRRVLLIFCRDYRLFIVSRWEDAVDGIKENLTTAGNFSLPYTSHTDRTLLDANRSKESDGASRLGETSYRYQRKGSRPDPFNKDESLSQLPSTSSPDIGSSGQQLRGLDSAGGD